MVSLAARLFFLAFLTLFVLHAVAADVPPKPPRYFNDFASLVDSQTAEKLNRQLEDFERQTSNQLLVYAITGQVELPAELIGLPLNPRVRPRTTSGCANRLAHPLPSGGNEPSWSS